MAWRDTVRCMLAWTFRYYIFREEAIMDKIQAFVNEQLKTEVPQFNIGDTVEVQNKIKEGSRDIAYDW